MPDNDNHHPSEADRMWRMLVQMRGSVAWNPRDGRWYVQAYGAAKPEPGKHDSPAAKDAYYSDGDHPEAAIVDCYRQWKAAGMPLAQPYTADELAQLDAWLHPVEAAS